MAEPSPIVAPRAEFERTGLGWTYRPREAPVILTFDRLVERRDEVTAEVHITLADGAHVARRRLNLLGSRSLTDWARELEDFDGGAPWPWRTVLNIGCESTLEAYRRGSPIIPVSGSIVRPPPVEWQCHELVIANVVNCWVAAAGTGKSTFAKAYAYAHASGTQFIGRSTQRGVPLYLDYEDTHESFLETMYFVSGGAPLPLIHWQKGTGPIASRVNQLAEAIDRLGITLIVVDAVAASTGAQGERTYDAIAVELEQSLIQLPQVTVLLLDHITGDELKSGAVPLKARGGSRKYEFTRFQWTLSLDRDAAAQGRHVVGWTHTKHNRTRQFPPFGIELFHRDGELGFGPVGATDIAPTAANMTVLARCLAALDEEPRGLRTDDLAEIIYGEITKTRREAIRVTLKRDGGRSVRLTSDGFWMLTRQTSRAPIPLFKGESDDLE